jgi:hypothetical protein
VIRVFLGLAAVLAGALLNVPVILTCHGVRMRTLDLLPEDV